MTARQVIVTAGWGCLFALAFSLTDEDSAHAVVIRRAKVEQNVRDSILKTQIQIAIMKSLDAGDALRVGVTVEGGTVTLSGEVDSPTSSALASEAALSLDGVTIVKNAIVRASDAAHDQAAEARLKDAMLEAEIMLHLLQSLGAAAMDIQVRSSEGVVRLSGEVTSSSKRLQAVSLAGEVRGVRRVADSISTSR